MRLALYTAVCMLAAAATARADAGGKHVRVDLIADAASVRPGQPFTVGVRFRIEPGWHIYWTNPGDSGLPTRVELDLPPGLTAGATQYPVPAVLRFPGDIVNYGYENQVVLLVPVTASPTASAAARIVVHADYLVCKDACLPGRATASLDLPSATDDAATIKRWSTRLPRDLEPRLASRTQTDSPAAADGGYTESATIRWRSPVPSAVEFVPPVVDGFEIVDLRVRTTGDRTDVTFAVRRTDPKAVAPPQLNGLLVYAGPDGRPVGGPFTFFHHSTQPSPAAP